MTLALTLILVAAVLAAPAAIADGTLMSWSGRDLKGSSRESFDAAKKKSPKESLEKNRSIATWPEAYHLLLAANEHRTDKQFLAGLAAQVTDTTERRLAHTERLIIWERIVSGEILFEGKGLQISDDLFTVAGRANWILRTITGRNFGHVKPGTPRAELLRLQHRWQQWLAGEEVPDHQDPYPSKVEGLEEIRSLTALNALIVSLRPSEGKRTAMAMCLHQLYGLDTLPSDPGHPARLCIPDTYTHSYLAKLTDVSEQHDSEWWARWWEDHKNALRWDADTARFRASSQK